jgi:hypothetical protein
MMYPRERHPKPTVGVKTMMIAAAAVVPHWRIRAKIDALNIEMSAPGGNTTFLRGLSGSEPQR